MFQQSVDVRPTPSTVAPEAALPAARLSRRKFLGGIGGTAAVAAAGLGGVVAASREVSGVDTAEPLSAVTPAARRAAAYQYRMSMANRMRDFVNSRPQLTNGDEARYPNRIGSYTKGLPHNAFGEVDATAWASFMKAVDTGLPSDWEGLILGGGRPQVSPQAGLAYDLYGYETQALSVPPAPALASAEEAAEGIELYWMSLLRDTNFNRYGSSADAHAAIADLNAAADFKGAKRNGLVTPQTLFRDPFVGCAVGPYLSQFMWMNTPFGSEFIDRRSRVFVAGDDQLTHYDDWLAVQDGGVGSNSSHFESERRYLRNGRDLAEWVHMDVLFQAYFNACLILGTPPNSADEHAGGIGAPLNPGNPYRNSRTQVGFSTFGPPAIKALLCEVATRALKATWWQKWFVHRRLRPEAFGGVVHHSRDSNRYPGVLHSQILDSPAVDRVFSKYGTYLLPMAFPEGSPTHGSYTAGHATVAGCCVTILKAMFDTSYVIPNPVQASDDGRSLVPYVGPPLTVGGELNKLASNIATGRNIAGVHWRSDAVESMRYGEAIAIEILKDHNAGMNEIREGFFSGYHLTKFDGTQLVVNK